MEYLATRGYDPAFGARPVKRVVQQELETALAKGILRGDFAVREAVGQGRRGKPLVPGLCTRSARLSQQGRAGTSAVWRGAC